MNGAGQDRHPDADRGARQDGGNGGGAPRRPRRAVISSVTGEPIDWDEPAADAERPPATDRRPLLPDRVDEDAPEPDESDDARITGDVPPHWGRGR